MSTAKIFFSYSRMDSVFALRLAKDIRGAGEDIWMDQLDIQPGQHWDAAVEKALLSCSCVLVILSPSSVASNNVKDEISFAIETGKKIIPVRIEDLSVPFRLHRLTHIDFYKSYEDGLKKLLTTVKELSSVGTPVLEPELSTTSMLAEGVQEYEVVAVDENKDMQMWDQACQANTIPGFEIYLQESPFGAFREEAKVMIGHLEMEKREDELEILMWEKAKTEKTHTHYAKYLKDYPNGRYKTQAEAAIAKLDAETASKKVIAEIPVPKPEVKKVIEQPQSAKKPFSKKALGLILGGVLVVALILFLATRTHHQEDPDQSAWAKASLTMDQASLMTYLNAFPNGKYSVTAKQILDSFNLAKQAETKTATETNVEYKPTESPEVQKNIPSTPSEQTPKTNTKPQKPVVPVKEKVVSPYVLGQSYQGGTIVHIDGNGQHGLIVSDRELGPVDFNTALKKSAAFKLNGFEDWRLPTKNELSLLYQNRKIIGLVGAGMYWSSTEAGESICWVQNLMDGHDGSYNKAMNCNVRVVRTF